MVLDRSVLSPESGLKLGGTTSVEDVGTHQLKCWPEFYQAILEGQKSHDLRRADDRRFRIGDVLCLREFDPRTERYTGREQKVKVTYITSADVPCALSKALDPAYCILSIKTLT